MITSVLSKLHEGQSLDFQEMSAVMQALMGGKLTDAEIEDFLLSLRKKGETVLEIQTAAEVMRAHSLKLSRSFPDLLDTCGTGGDGMHTLNISTLAAITAAGAGVRVAKHGNRSVSSVCGSADLLEGLGIKMDAPLERIEQCLEKTGFAFLFAPTFHPATRFAMPARRKIQGKTIFNLLGPLSNPAGASYQLVGVYDKKWLRPMAEALKVLGIKRALVVHGRDGMDEISPCADTDIAELNASQIKEYAVSPEELGFKKINTQTLRCVSKEQCGEIALEILSGKRSPQSEAVSLNAGAAIYTAGAVSSLKEGMALAQRTLQSGAGLKKLEEIKNILGAA
jgi:anthranilate phosphoribosyltransferase